AAPLEIYSVSLHDALPICVVRGADRFGGGGWAGCGVVRARRWVRVRVLDGALVRAAAAGARAAATRVLSRAVSDRTRKLVVAARSEEHTSELQSRSDLVCR